MSFALSAIMSEGSDMLKFTLHPRRSGAFVLAASVCLLGYLSMPANGAVQVTGIPGPGGHTYDLIEDHTIDWSHANTAANASGGYLVTINSASEQAFLETLLAAHDPGPGEYWIGMTKTSGGQLSGYSWIQGPQTTYQHWLPGEPNNFGGNEHVGGILWSRAADSSASRRGFWNDLPDPYHVTTAGAPDLVNGGYLVEHNNAVAVPLPQAAVMTSIGLVLVWRARKKSFR
jgi:hypothetical protein